MKAETFRADSIQQAGTVSGILPAVVWDRSQHRVTGRYERPTHSEPLRDASAVVDAKREERTHAHARLLELVRLPRASAQVVRAAGQPTHHLVRGQPHRGDRLTHSAVSGARQAQAHARGPRRA
jgi:hypothetical protein